MRTSILVTVAKAKTGALKFGSPGIGTGSHVGSEMFNLAAGIRSTHVPANASEGIEKMQAHRRKKKLKLDPQWEVVKQWLIDQKAARTSSARVGDEATERLQPAEQLA